MGWDTDDILFRSPNSIVFQSQPVNTLDELKSVSLRNMDAVGSILVRRVAYQQLLIIFLPNKFKFKIFLVEGDEHVRAMFDLHRKYGPQEVMELLIEMQTMHRDVGGPSSSARGGVVLICNISIFGMSRHYLR
ncbi:hypothetical protein PIB30_077863 [Stylosanthes scabra]|uniref:Uncharacterized protein n=1 Tax=Stylosanthes scabra TaxID=79078 RepID=A0ABU6QQ98_9FABA|nr:hypothetical protein [Stylosanthes scabra]